MKSIFMTLLCKPGRLVGNARLKWAPYFNRDVRILGLIELNSNALQLLTTGDELETIIEGDLLY